MILNFIEWLGRWLFNAIAHRMHQRRASSQQKASGATSLEEDATTVHIGDLLPSRSQPSIREAVWLAFKTRLRGLVITGKMGVGKSTLIRTLLRHDLTHGNGVVIIDARGEALDLAQHMLPQYLTEAEYEDRVVILDARQRSAHGKPGEPVVVFNPFLAVEDPYATIAEFKELLLQVWGSAMGVQVLDDFQHIGLALTLSPAGPFSLLDIERVLTDPAFRAKVADGILDPLVTDYLTSLDRINDPTGRASALRNKLSPILASNPRLRTMLTGTEKSYSPFQHFEHVKNPIVLVGLAIDEVGPSAAAMTGAMVLSALIKAQMRSDRAVAEEPEEGVLFVLDELSAYAAGVEGPLKRLVQEGRKFGAYGVYSFQTPGTLPVAVRTVIQDVVGTACHFAQGGQQADTIAGWVASEELPRPVVRQFLMQAKTGEALLVREGQAPRRMKTLFTPYPTVDPAKARALRKAALNHWGVPVSGETARRSSPPSGDAAATPSATPVAEAAVEAREVDDVPRPKRRKKGAGK